MDGVRERKRHHFSVQISNVSSDLRVYGERWHWGGGRGGEPTTVIWSRDGEPANEVEL